MNRGNVTTAEEKLLRETIERQAPRPSIAHNQAVMDAARKTAAAKRRRRLIERNRSWSGIGIAAAVMLAAGVWISSPQVPMIDGTLRGDDRPAITMPADNATLASVPTTFRWSEVAGTDRYRVRVHDADASVVWQSAWIESTEIELAAEEAPKLSAGGRFFWIVELSGESAKRSLGPYWFTLE